MAGFMELSSRETNYIRTSLGRCNAEGLSRELGRAKSTIKKKLREIRESERLGRMC